VEPGPPGPGQADPNGKLEGIGQPVLSGLPDLPVQKPFALNLPVEIYLAFGRLEFVISPQLRERE
jgi:hypothetical protein